MLKKIKLNNILGLFLMAIFSVALIACEKNVDNDVKYIPNLKGLTQTEIREEFTKNNIVVTLDFQNIFDKEADEEVFHSFGEGFKVGDEIQNGAVLTIYISNNTLILPELEGLDRDQIKSRLEGLGLESRDFSLKGDISKGVEVGTFIKYQGYSPGDTFDFSEKLVVFYDLSKSLPNLEGKNKYEINKIFDDLTVPVEFEYTLNNEKEYDSFDSYIDYEVGDSVSFEDTVVVKLYKNDNVNIGETILNDYELFISKYIDGTLNNQAIELFNPTNEAIDLTNYYLAILSNGSFVPTSEIIFSGALDPNETFLIVKTGAEAELLAKADLVSSNLKFDGNDTIQLRRSNDTYIDTIYHVGNISFTLDEEIFVRKMSITAGNRSFSQAEWVGFIPSYFNPIGTHPWPGLELAGPDFVEMTESFQEYGTTKVEVTRLADGDTIYANSLQAKDETSYQGDQRLRFLMVDTAETEKPGVVGEPYAQVAKTFIETLIDASTEIYIQADASTGLKGTYGRHLALIWVYLPEDVEVNNIAAEGTVTIEKGFRLLNYELIRMGLGEKNIAKTQKYREAPILSNRYLYQWGNEAERYAVANNLGIYSGVSRP